MRTNGNVDFNHDLIEQIEGYWTGKRKAFTPNNKQLTLHDMPRQRLTLKQLLGEAICWTIFAPLRNQWVLKRAAEEAKLEVWREKISGICETIVGSDAELFQPVWS